MLVSLDQNNVIINSMFPYGNPFYMYKCTNISIVNITILHSIFTSHDIAIFNVNTSYIDNTLDIILYTIAT